MIEHMSMSMCGSKDYCRGWNDAIKEMPKWNTGVLPEYEGNYLVATRATGCVCIRHFQNGRWNFGEPLAWMELPEAYKEERDSDNE